MESIRKFADEFHASGKKLDMLFNCHGFKPCSSTPLCLTADNFELTMSANHLGLYLRVSARHSEGSAIFSSENLRLGIRLGLGSVVWLWQYQELFHATTMNDGFQNGGPFGMAALRNGGPEPYLRFYLLFERQEWHRRLEKTCATANPKGYP